MQLFKYWNFIGTLTEIETYVSKYENDDWNCAPIIYEADIYIYIYIYMASLKVDIIYQ